MARYSVNCSITLLSEGMRSNITPFWDSIARLAGSDFLTGVLILMSISYDVLLIFSPSTYGLKANWWFASYLYLEPMLNMDPKATLEMVCMRLLLSTDSLLMA